MTPPRTPATFETSENSEPFTPAVRIADSIDVDDPAIGVARSMGITTAVVLPGSSDLIGGLGLVIKTRSVRLLDCAPATGRFSRWRSGSTRSRGSGPRADRRRREWRLAR